MLDTFRVCAVAIVCCGVQIIFLSAKTHDQVHRGSKGTLVFTITMEIVFKCKNARPMGLAGRETFSNFWKYRDTI